MRWGLSWENDLRFALALGILIAALSGSPYARAETTTIENNRGEKVKLCTYRSDDKSLARPRKCWMMKPRRRIKWDRGDDDSAFDVRIFGPGVFELPICVKRNIRDSFKVEITTRKSKQCVTSFERISVPARQREPGARVLVNRSDDRILVSGDDIEP